MGHAPQGRCTMGEKKIWTADDVADHFEEAFRTLRKLPPVKAKGYFNAWPEIARTSREIAAMEPQPMRVWPSAASISSSTTPGCP